MASLAIMVIPQKFEAKTLLQIGSIGEIAHIGEESKPIESPINTVQRLKSLGFQQDVARQIQAKHPEYDYVSLLKELDKVSINVIKNTDLIEITLTARSKDEAMQRSKIYVSVLKQRHQQLSEPLIKMQHTQLLLAEQHIHEFEAESTKASLPTNKPFIELAQLAKNDKQIFWQQQVMQLQQIMTYPNTRPTTLVEAISVLDDAVFPKKSVFLLAGSMLGFALGLLSFIVSRNTKALTF